MLEVSEDDKQALAEQKKAKRVRKNTQNVLEVTEVDEQALAKAQETYKKNHKPEAVKRGRKPTRHDIYMKESIEKIENWESELVQKKAELEECKTDKEKELK